MKIEVKVNTSAKSDSVKKIDTNNYLIKTTTKPEKGKANHKIIKLLSDFFKIKKSQIIIISGYKNKDKVVEILENL